MPLALPPGTNFVVAFGLVVLGACLFRSPAAPSVLEASESFRIAPQARWVWLSLAIGISLLAGSVTGHGSAVIAFYGLIIALAFAAGFVFCSRYSVTVGRKEIIICGVFRAQAFPGSRIARLVETSDGRSPKTVSAFDAGGKRMFVLSDNVKDYDRLVILLVQSLPAGAVHEFRSPQSTRTFIVGEPHPERET